MSFTNTRAGNQVFRVRLQDVRDDQAQQLMRVTGRAGEQLGANVLVPRVQAFGLTSHPPAGAHGIALAPAGDPSAAVLLGVESGEHRRRNLEAGGTEIYDANGNVISLVQANIRIVSPSLIVLQAPQIALDGECFLGGPPGSGVPASRQGTLDTAGNADTGNLASRVKIV